MCRSARLARSCNMRRAHRFCSLTHGREPSKSDEPKDSSSSNGSSSDGSKGGSSGSSSFWTDVDAQPLRRNVAILVGSQVLLNVGVSQVVPCLPILATEMGLGGTGIGSAEEAARTRLLFCRFALSADAWRGRALLSVLMAVPAVARLCLNLPFGRVADTIGRKPLMRYGTLLTAAGCIGTGALMHSGLVPVLASRLLVGAGTAASMTGSGAMMADLTDSAPRHRAQVMVRPCPCAQPAPGR
jgi:hypothetical protein